MNDFAIAGLQLALSSGDNRERIEHEVGVAMTRYPWLRMIVLPELASFGPALGRAEPLPGPTEHRWQALARKHAIWLVPGSLYEKEGERIYNLSLIHI